MKKMLIAEWLQKVADRAIAKDTEAMTVSASRPPERKFKPRTQRAQTQNNDPKHVSEMPYLHSDEVVGGKSLGIVDLRIERYPNMPKAGKDRLMGDFLKSGLVGQKDGEWLHFTRDGIEVITRDQAKDIPRLPEDWESHAEFTTMEHFDPTLKEPVGSKSFGESVRKLPTMTSLFGRKRRCS